jgi:glyoxylase-like metal-dependent hydrolase (beta-lactamase superfamily II)
MVDATVTPVDRGTIHLDENYAIEHATVATASEPNPEAERIAGKVYNLVVDHPEATILWDTGSHPGAGAGHWPPALYDAFEHADADERDLPTALDDAGYALEDVDCVVQSHLHLDHAGSLYRFAGTDVPVYVHEEELKYAYYSAKTDEGSAGYVLEDFDHDLNWRVVHGDETHFEGVEFLHLPGHTPGLMGMRVDVDGYGTALFIGDQADERANYEKGIPMGGGLLWSKHHWRESLRRVQELQRRTGADVFCGHASEDFERLQGGLP